MAINSAASGPEHGLRAEVDRQKEADRSLQAESEIIKRILGGDRNAFAHLVNKYSPKVSAIVSRKVPYEAVEEVSQDVFIRAYTSLAGFKGKGSFAGWLSGIAVRTCYDYWRKAYRNKEVPLSGLGDGQSEAFWSLLEGQGMQSNLAGAAEVEARDMLDWALNHLSPKDRMALTLTHMEGYTSAEAAELLGWSAANVKVRAFRARRKLRTILEESMPSEGGRDG